MATIKINKIAFIMPPSTYDITGLSLTEFVMVRIALGLVPGSHCLYSQEGVKAAADLREQLYRAGL